MLQVTVFGLVMEVLREVQVSSLAIAFASMRMASKVPQVSHQKNRHEDSS
jgi:hypothetical protein